MTDLVSLAAPDSAEAEAYRGLRANLLATAGDARVLLVASPAPGAGAAEAAANLAVVCAQGGLRVVLADADLRGPTLHVMFGLANDKGFAAAIEAGEPEPAPTAVPGLSLLPAGGSAVRPSDLFSRPATAAVIGMLRDASDLVLLVAPPALTASDAATLARHADGVVMILAAGRSRRDDAAQARAAFDQVGAAVLGVILTGIDPADAAYRYYRSGPSAAVGQGAGGGSSSIATP